MGSVRKLLGLIIVLTLTAVVIDLPKIPYLDKSWEFKQGLDIAGGVHLAP